MSLDLRSRWLRGGADGRKDGRADEWTEERTSQSPPPVSKKRGSMVGKMKEDREEGRKYAKAQ